MALSANSVFEVRTAGNDTNGGGFVTGAAGTDYSQQDSKNTVTADISTTDAVAAGTTTITSATAVFGSTIVGNIIYLQGGTGSLAAGWYQVATFVNVTTITVDRTVATGTGITMNIGGALASPGMAGGVGLVAGNTIHIKAGTYTIASATINIATGCFSSGLGDIHLEGYQTTRGDLGTAPLLQASGISTFVVITATALDCCLYNVNIDGAGLTSSRGVLFRGQIYQCTVSNCTNNAFIESTLGIFIKCTATGCATVVACGAGTYIDCVAYNNTIGGFSIASGRTCHFCIADSNSGASSDGFDLTGSAQTGAYNCVSYNNGRDGFRISDDAKTVMNCIAETNAGYGINNPGNGDVTVLLHNATYNNTSGGISAGTGKSNLNIGAVTGSGSFFTDAPNQDFSLNNTAGAGAVARAAGFPGALAVGGTGYLDIGALQHADPAGGGGGLRLAGRGGLAT